MAKTIRNYVDDGVTTNYPIDFVLGYLDNRDYVYVYAGDDYTVQLDYTWVDSTTISITTPVLNQVFAIRRVVPRTGIVNNYSDGAIQREKELDQSFLQAIMLFEEIEDGFLTVQGVGTFNSNINMLENDILNAGSVSTTSLTVNGITIDQQVANAAASAAAALASENAASDLVDGLTDIYFNDVTELVASSLTAGLSARTRGRISATGVGAGEYLVKTAAQADAAGDLIDEVGAGFTIANGNVVVLQQEGAVSIKKFGATGDGVADDSAAIAAAIAAFGNIYIPIGTYIVSSIDLAGLSNVSIVGEDRGLSTLKLKDGANTHVISLSGSSLINLENLRLDGNRVNQTGGHGIRFGGADGVRINNVTIRGCYSYGIGMQAGTNTDITIDTFTILDTGQDGIDIKDYDLANDNITITNGIIKDFGDNATGQCGLDFRGPVIASNLHIEAGNPDTRGWRARVSSAQGRAGSGSVSNVRVKCTGTNSYGFNTEGASVEDLVVDNVVVSGGFLGVIDSNGGVYSNLVTDGATGTDAVSLAGEDNIISGLKVSDCTGRGMDVEAGATGNMITGFNFSGIGSTEVIRIQATANTNSLINGVVPSGKSIGDSAVDTTIKDVKNWKTSDNLLSADQLVDSTGSKVFNIAHGLDVTPALEDVTLSFVRSTGSPTDWGSRYLQVEGVSSSQITVRFYVDTASATVGAAVKVAVKIRSKNS